MRGAVTEVDSMTSTQIHPHPERRFQPRSARGLHVVRVHAQEATELAAIATVANAAYFPGLAALVNSLHLTGHTCKVTVLDLGLTDDQRSRLAPFCRFIAADAELARHPMLAKATVASHVAEQGVVVVVDADVIITGDLSPLVRAAGQGRIAAVRDVDQRRFTEWQELLDLADAPRYQAYINSGLVAFSNVHWPDLPKWWNDACSRVPHEATRSGGAPASSPLWDSDQDALNAVLMTRIPDSALMALEPDEFPLSRDHRLATKVLDSGRLACSHRGASVIAIHDAGLHARPWLPWAARGVRRDSYTRLLPRLWFADDLAVKLRADEVAPWMATGLIPRIHLAALDVRNAATAMVANGRTAARDRLQARLRGSRRRP